MIELLSYGFMQKALIGGVAIGLSCGLVGPFLVLRRMSLLGDGLAHLTFGGVALGLLLGVHPLLAALLSAVLGSFWIKSLMKKNVYGEAAIALVLSLGIGLGVVVIGAVRGFNVNLFSYLIGSILALNGTDILFACALVVAAILFVVLSYRDMFLLTFNEELAKLMGKRIELVNVLFTVLVAMVVVLSIRAVGILLVSALLVLPTMISLNISKSFKQTIILSSTFAVLSVMIGVVSSYLLDIPPSGAIVLLLFFCFVVTHVVRR